MKQWMKKLLDQFDVDWSSNEDKERIFKNMKEELATLLFLIDTYNKHLIEIDNHPVRKVRETLDDFAKGLVSEDQLQMEKTLFRFRQFFASYRLDEYAYVEKTFEDFKGIIWDFADQLAEEIRLEKNEDVEMNVNLEQLKEAVEANSIDALRTTAREFIDSYIEKQSRQDDRKNKRLDHMQKNLSIVKKQLMSANKEMMTDHLTGAFNRKCFDEQSRKYAALFEISKANISIIAMDIDFFKKINDTHGHDIGDFVLKECVRVLKEIFSRDNDFVARVGGEEFAILLPDHRIEHAVIKAENAIQRIRKEVFITGSTQLRFTVSMGLAQLQEGETVEAWIKRADEALYESKKTGRNKFTIAPHSFKPRVA